MTTPSRPSLPAGAVVLRVLEVKTPFFASPDHLEPTWEAFKPSSADVKEGEERGLPPGVSVFDREKTTVSQAIAIRGWFAARAERELRESRAYAIGVDQIRAIVRPYCAQVDVMADPLIEEGVRELPGAEGHAAIRGLHEPDKKRRKSGEYLAMMDRLAATAVKVYPEG